ncbi:hypothetical protein E2C01_095710 [Portunus trituberculatus]|uniref:Uncharacterized protein n=1 Tax=Portunus trituberculatus TaxID=210409 RepID=A0A5B7K4X8_PORTR|nr:hypothetical protein [Portunus trituberculatus]
MAALSCFPEAAPSRPAPPRPAPLRLAPPRSAPPRSTPSRPARHAQGPSAACLVPHTPRILRERT